MKKDLFITIVTGITDLSVFCTGILYFTNSRYSISIDNDGLSVISIPSKYFCHKLRFEYNIDGVKYYKLDLS